MTRPPYSARYGSPWTAAPPVERDVSMRAEVLGSEGRWVEACTLVQPPAICRDGVLTSIARHLPAAQDDQARALLLRVFSRAMQTAKSPYRDVLALVNEKCNSRFVRERAGCGCLIGVAEAEPGRRQPRRRGRLQCLPGRAGRRRAAAGGFSRAPSGGSRSSVRIAGFGRSFRQTATRSCRRDAAQGQRQSSRRGPASQPVPAAWLR